MRKLVIVLLTGVFAASCPVMAYAFKNDGAAKEQADRMAKDEAKAKANAEAATDQKDKVAAEKRARDEAAAKANAAAEKEANDAASARAKARAEADANAAAEQKAKDAAEKHARDDADAKARAAAEKEANDAAIAKPTDRAEKPASDPLKGNDKKEAQFALCKLSDISPGASACSGFYAGNLNGGGEDKAGSSITGLNQLLGSDVYSAINFTWLVGLGNLSEGDTIDFGKKLYGQTIVSFHVGGANGQADGVGYNATAFYLFDAGEGGLQTFGFNVAGLSNARLYSTESMIPTGAIPEPEVWMMMIMGFGALGAIIRRRKAVIA